MSLINFATKFLWLLLIPYLIDENIFESFVVKFAFIQFIWQALNFGHLNYYQLEQKPDGTNRDEKLLSRILTFVLSLSCCVSILWLTKHIVKDNLEITDGLCAAIVIFTCYNNTYGRGILLLD